MSIAMSALDSRIAVYEDQYIINNCCFSTLANNGGIYNVRVGGTKITLPAAKRLIWKLNNYLAHCGGGAGSDLISVYMYVKNETTAATVAQTTTLTVGRGASSSIDSQEINFEGSAGSTYQLYMYVSVASDDHCVAFFNGGILWVLPTTQTTAPTTGYLLNT